LLPSITQLIKMEINIIHKKQTDEEAYENVKKLHNQYPDIFMNPEEWKKLRLVEIRKEGKVWSK
jgi:hypothetical protein